MYSMPGAGVPPHWGVFMSQHLRKLKRAANSKMPDSIVKKKYAAMREKSQRLTNQMILDGQVPDGQGCAYRGGFPV